MPHLTLRRRSLSLAVLLATLPALVPADSAWPAKPVKLIVPFAPGRPTDTVARLLAERLQAQWQQPVVMDCKPGAGTVVGTDFVARSAPEDPQIAFARALGPLDLGLRKLKGGPHRFRHAELADISNVKVDGAVAERSHAKIVGNVANQLWHSDSSFQRPRAKYSMLSAAVVPAQGGETEFADLRSHVYQHHRQVGDLVMWDNTATLHRGRWFDLAQRRELRRATTEEVLTSPEARAGLACCGPSSIAPQPLT